MKITKFDLVEDQTKPTKATFDFESGGVRYRGWRVIESSNYPAWVAPPSFRDYAGDGRLHRSVILSPELEAELNDLALKTWELARR